MTDDTCLDSAQLERLEQAFRSWAGDSSRRDVRFSRLRILLIFLLIRHTGAKLHEILALDPRRDIDPAGRTIQLGASASERRIVPLTESLAHEIALALADPGFLQVLEQGFAVDQAFVRRKFYEQADACGFARRLCGPEMIRRSRGVELMENNMPLPAVQKLLGHAHPKQTSTYVNFSEEELRQVTGFFLEREQRRTTSARNAFFGKIETIDRGDIQARLRLVTSSGHVLVAVITNDSLNRLGLRPGGLVVAEVKAPWVILARSEDEPASSAENRLQGNVVRVTPGRVTTEYVVRLTDGLEICAIVSAVGDGAFAPKIGESVWALFNCFAVILHADGPRTNAHGGPAP